MATMDADEDSDDDDAVQVALPLPAEGEWEEVVERTVVVADGMVQYVWGQDVDRVLKLGNFASTT